MSVCVTHIQTHAPTTNLPKTNPIQYEKVRVNEPGSQSMTPVRLMASSMTGEFLRTDAFLEYPDPVNGITKQVRHNIYMVV